MKTDSLIFDMDGTIWDAVDTYVASWNKGAEIYGLEKRFTREGLEKLMGQEIKKLLEATVPELPEEERWRFFHTVVDQTDEAFAELGANIYPGVVEGMEKLSKKYKLFVLSNCDKGGIPQMLGITGLSPYITDYFEYGMNTMPKNHNMHLLKEKHNLQHPVYVGDTEGDSYQTRLAGLPFVFVAYGHGNTEHFDIKFDSFDQLTEYFMNL